MTNQYPKHPNPKPEDADILPENKISNLRKQPEEQFHQLFAKQAKLNETTIYLR